MRGTARAGMRAAVGGGGIYYKERLLGIMLVMNSRIAGTDRTVVECSVAGLARPRGGSGDATLAMQIALRKK